MRVGTRASQLARVQTSIVIERLSALVPDLLLQAVPITTGGDVVLDRPIAEVGTRGVFVKELEEALLREEVDFVVHSLKDMPTDCPEGLELVACLDRDDPRDVLVSRGGKTLAELAPGSAVATSSRRRTAQISAIRADLTFVDIRGNIQTRLRKLDEGQCDSMILAAAGLLRLDLGERIAQFFDPSQSTPAAGQGVLAVQCRAGDRATVALLRELDEPVARAESDAERSFLAELGGGCSVPIGILARAKGEKLLLTGCIASLDGERIFRDTFEGELAKPVESGKRFADSMVKSGAGEVVESLRASVPNISPP
ncbi:MAG: hydroxymethylbilane synthase [Cyanobacteria bacterium]|nr:hydroxymethylbilane synthase [Cyanobacteriota bacterium]